VEAAVSRIFFVERFPQHPIFSKLNQTCAVQIQVRFLLFGFPEHASREAFLGGFFLLARSRTCFRGRSGRYPIRVQRTSKRQKDLAEVAGLWEGYPHLTRSVPQNSDP